MQQPDPLRILATATAEYDMDAESALIARIPLSPLGGQASQLSSRNGSAVQLTSARPSTNSTAKLPPHASIPATPNNGEPVDFKTSFGAVLDGDSGAPPSPDQAARTKSDIKDSAKLSTPSMSTRNAAGNVVARDTSTPLAPKTNTSLLGATGALFSSYLPKTTPLRTAISANTAIAPINLPQSVDAMGAVATLERTSNFLTLCTAPTAAELASHLAYSERLQAPVTFEEAAADDMLALACVVCELYLGSGLLSLALADASTSSLRERLLIKVHVFRAQVQRLPRDVRDFVESIFNSTRNDGPSASFFLHQHAPDTPLYFPPSFHVLLRFLTELKYSSAEGAINLIREWLPKLIRLEDEPFQIFVPIMCDIIRSPLHFTATLDMIPAFCGRLGPVLTKSLLMAPLIQLIESPSNMIQTQLYSYRVCKVLLKQFGLANYTEHFVGPIVELVPSSSPEISSVARDTLLRLSVQLGFVFMVKFVSRPIMRQLSNTASLAPCKLLQSLSAHFGPALFVHVYIPFVLNQVTYCLALHLHI